MSGSDSVLFWIVVITAVLVGAFWGALAERYFGREKFLEKFLTFCTEQGLSYAKCKEEWQKP